MNMQCGRFNFTTDMNLDGAFTVSDVWLVAKQILILPSNLIIAANEQFPQLVNFFEIDCGTGNGYGSIIFSLFAWWIIFTVASFFDGN